MSLTRSLLMLGLILLAAFAGYWLYGVQQRAGRAPLPRGDEALANQPTPAGSTDDPPADDVAPSARNPFIRALEQVIGKSPVLKQERDGLQEQLREADDVFSRAKRNNASALRQANRQVRIRDRNSPNIILIVADELSSKDLGCYGQTEIETPAIDRMADDGCRFTQFYAGSADAPGSQWSLLTSLRSTRASAADSFSLRPAGVTIAEVLWQAGYATELVGDASLGGVLDPADPRQHGFDRWYGYRRREDATAYPEYIWDNGTRLRVLDNADGEQVVREDELLTREVLASLERHRRGRPFFLYVMHTWPHPSDSATVDHASMVSRFDRTIGSIRQRLEQLGMARNSILLLTSENGAAEGTKEVRADGPGELRGGRGELYEGGIRVPLIVCGPGHLRGGVTIDRMCGVWDLLPTCSEMVGAWNRPRNIDGISLIGNLRGTTQRNHEYLAWAEGRAGRGQAIRFGDWKAVRSSPSAAIELYDLAIDPGETENLASRNPEVIARIERFLVDSAGQ